MDDKSKRGFNFTEEETFLLIRLIKEKKHIVDSKRTDHVTSELKKKAWNQICEKFNGTSHVTFRSTDTLKKKYTNLKTSFKEKYNLVTNSWRVRFGISMIDEVVKDLMLSPIKTELEDNGLENGLEKFRGFNSEVRILPKFMDTHFQDCNNFIEVPDNKLEYTSQADYSNLDSDIVPCFDKEEAMSNDELPTERQNDVILMRKRQLEEEHQLKMKHLKTEHKMRMQILECDLLIRQKQLENISK